MRPINYECPACGAINSVTCIGEVKAQTYGRAEQCYPAEPAEIDPGACFNCNHEFDIDKVFDELPKPEDFDRDDRDDADEDGKNWSDH